MSPAVCGKLLHLLSHKHLQCAYAMNETGLQSDSMSSSLMFSINPYRDSCSGKIMTYWFSFKIIMV